MQLQFHHQGYRPGTPPSFATHPGTQTPPPGPPSTESWVNVLIIGAGAAGLALAAQLSRFQHVSVALVDQRPGRLLVGQADGIQCRSIEMFNAFGFADKVLREAYWVNETVFWKPGGDGITRSGRVRDVEQGLSEYPHVILNQARILDFWLAEMKAGATPLIPCYGRRLKQMTVNRAAGNKHPVTAVMDVLSDGQPTGVTQTIHAEYAVGCDGARSLVRQSLGLTLEGDSTNAAWGVMDILCRTNFPDIRFKCVINSPGHGNLVIIPREGGHLVRLYIELDSTIPRGQRVDKSSITADTLIETARAMFHPYTLDVKQVAWWSVYEIGQRLCNMFDDSLAADGTRREPRVFIAGDACHTHSPKAGQGMNVGMQDGYNLGWKLAAVCRGVSRPAILDTYHTERHEIAATLIAFDRQLSAMLDSRDKVDPAAFQAYFTQSARYTAGLGYAYGGSTIVALNASRSAQLRLAGGFPVGERFHSALLTRFWDAKPAQLGHAVAADGRWRIFVFNDNSDPWDPSSRLSGLCGCLERLAMEYTRPGDDTDAEIETLFVLQQRHDEVQAALLDGSKQLPGLLTPKKGKFELADIHKVFCDEEPYFHVWGSNGPWQSVYECRSVSRAEGAVIVVRPDGYVAGVCGLDKAGQEFLFKFFAGVLVPVSDSSTNPPQDCPEFL